jgi:hypothetical protein
MDVFRQTYTPVTDEVKEKMVALKVMAQEMWDFMDAQKDAPTDQRMIAVAKTKLEEVIMWAIKGMTA